MELGTGKTSRRFGWIPGMEKRWRGPVGRPSLSDGSLTLPSRARLTRYRLNMIPDGETDADGLGGVRLQRSRSARCQLRRAHARSAPAVGSIISAALEWPHATNCSYVSGFRRTLSKPLLWQGRRIEGTVIRPCRAWGAGVEGGPACGWAGEKQPSALAIF